VKRILQLWWSPSSVLFIAFYSQHAKYVIYVRSLIFGASTISLFGFEERRITLPACGGAVMIVVIYFLF
jgi:hypothetical protein